MITVTVDAKVVPRKQEEFLQTIHSLRNDLNKKGSSKYPTLYQEVDDQTVFSLVCELKTKKDLKEFLNTEEFRVLLGAFKVLCEKPQMRFRYLCRNWPRHACLTDESLKRKLRKNGNRNGRGLKSLSKKC